MKKVSHLIFVTAFAIFATFGFAKDVVPYLPVDSLPNALAFLPPPPDTNSTQFVADISQYMWGKEMRKDSARAAQAIAQAAYKTDDVLKLFSEPFGMKLSKKKTPAIYNFVERGHKTIKQIGSVVKRHYQRKRPFDRFKEPTLVPSAEEELRGNGSYPSGHTIEAYSFALLLIEVNPAAQDALMKFAYEWGQSRVIAGFHWQSDVDASKMLVPAAFARIQGNKEFQADLKKAREEFARLKK
ncbi:MAG: phosphatase PAP2 family protein [Fibrobacter sp.]|nr:phosphatase PAP2 family protein [Fibrobacter sp.]